MLKKNDEAGFVGLIVLLIVIVLGVVIFSWLRIKAKQQGLELTI